MQAIPATIYLPRARRPVNPRLRLLPRPRCGLFPISHAFILMDSFFLLSCLFAGAAGSYIMGGTIQLLSRLAEGQEVDMVKALGSLFTGNKETATLNGILIHLAAGVGFGLVYGLVFISIGITQFPAVLLIGLGFGLLHGIGMSYVLMLFIADKHPLEEYRSVTLMIGAAHLGGHVVYGGVVGLVGGLASLIGQAAGLN